MLWYHSAIDLLRLHDPDDDPVCLSYLPVTLAHSTEVRDAQTNELLFPFPVLTDPAAASLRFEQARRSWDESKLFTQIKSVLASAAVPTDIDKVVALACWSVSSTNEFAMTGMAQHALALMIRDSLAAP
ncbi:hypothetical protein C8A05DRAFT_39027 [Staphylotrichum tortipilum]|uniref:Uncharacterized protein n=1 Tax=Staphylotrichum tortipilum TaxID=2831512 RepID=A0AAN6MAN5_9PEZI|nr:hypothetical protein C8A05DRAFT_39027 [Staphylotrichum longicolle]